jgi:hypothetical protein
MTKVSDVNPESSMMYNKGYLGMIRNSLYIITALAVASE